MPTTWTDAHADPRIARKFQRTDVGEALEVLRIQAPAIFAELSPATRTAHAPYVEQRYAFLGSGGSVGPNDAMNAAIRKAAGRTVVSDQQQPEEAPE
jgi:hypothetical protein